MVDYCGCERYIDYGVYCVTVISISRMVVIEAGDSIIASRDSTSVPVNHVSTNVLASFTMWVVLGFGCVVIVIISNAVVITTLRMINAVVSVMESPGTYMPRPLIRAEIRSKAMNATNIIKTRNQRSTTINQQNTTTALTGLTH